MHAFDSDGASLRRQQQHVNKAGMSQWQQMGTMTHNQVICFFPQGAIPGSLNKGSRAQFTDTTMTHLPICNTPTFNLALYGPTTGMCGLSWMWLIPWDSVCSLICISVCLIPHVFTALKKEEWMWNNAWLSLKTSMGGEWGTRCLNGTVSVR